MFRTNSSAPVFLQALASAVNSGLASPEVLLATRPLPAWPSEWLAAVAGGEVLAGDFRTAAFASSDPVVHRALAGRSDLSPSEVAVLAAGVSSWSSLSFEFADVRLLRAVVEAVDSPSKVAQLLAHNPKMPADLVDACLPVALASSAGAERFVGALWDRTDLGAAMERLFDRFCAEPSMGLVRALVTVGGAPALGAADALAAAVGADGVASCKGGADPWAQAAGELLRCGLGSVGLLSAAARLDPGRSDVALAVRGFALSIVGPEPAPFAAAWLSCLEASREGVAPPPGAALELVAAGEALFPSAGSSMKAPGRYLMGPVAGNPLCDPEVWSSAVAFALTGKLGKLGFATPLVARLARAYDGRPVSTELALAAFALCSESMASDSLRLLVRIGLGGLTGSETGDSSGSVPWSSGAPLFVGVDPSAVESVPVDVLLDEAWAVAPLSWLLDRGRSPLAAATAARLVASVPRADAQFLGEAVAGHQGTPAELVDLVAALDR